MYNFYVFYGYPSLFCDGVDLWPISTWRPYLNTRMSTPAPVTITMDGWYSAMMDSGWISASFRNDSSVAITARVYFVITEDSLYHPDPNGHAWHNHMARDMLPDQNGELVTINPGDTVIRECTMIVDPSWVESRCYVVAWIQADAPSRDVLQAGEIKLLSLPGIEENTNPEIRKPEVSLTTNPCLADNIRFSLNLPENTLYQIEIFDILGRQIKTIKGVSSRGTEVSCNLNQDRYDRVSLGIYFYRFSCPVLNTTGKIIVR